MNTEQQKSNPGLNRRSFLGVSVAIASTVVLPSTAKPSTETAANPSASLPILPGYTPAVSSAWIPRGGHEQALDLVRQTLDGATDFAWLKTGDRILVKLALNSGNEFPATTDPWLLKSLITILQEKGAGPILVGDQSGVADVHWTRDKKRGASRDLCQSTGLLGVIQACQAHPVFFEEEGYDAYIRTQPEGIHHWKSPLMITSVVNRVDHIIFMPRVASHVMGDITSGFKLGVGFLRDDSRREFHRGGRDFYAMYEEINEIPEIKNKLRLSLTSGRKVLTTIGPDIGTVAEPEQGLIFASGDLLANELLSYAWLKWNREFNTSSLARFTKGNVHRFRSFFNRKLVENTWGPDDEKVADLPIFSAGGIHDHPAILNHMLRLGGKPAGITWKSVNEISDQAISTYLKQQMKG
ncbi:DUF362 domain-containing protein [bacterium]|nr:DUF362 domain-containing protein [bacterium]